MKLVCLPCIAGAPSVITPVSLSKPPFTFATLLMVLNVSVLGGIMQGHHVQ